MKPSRVMGEPAFMRPWGKMMGRKLQESQQFIPAPSSHYSKMILFDLKCRGYR